VKKSHATSETFRGANIV